MSGTATLTSILGSLSHGTYQPPASFFSGIVSPKCVIASERLCDVEALWLEPQLYVDRIAEGVSSQPMQLDP